MESKAKRLINLCEQALAMKGDYDFGNLKYIGTGGLISKRVVKVMFEFDMYLSGKEEHLYLIECNADHPNQKYYCIAKDDVDDRWELKVDRFRILTAMLAEYTTKYRGLGYGPLRIVKGVETLASARGLGLGKKLYTILVDDLKWTLMGDQEQYEGARNLWVSLSNNPGFKVDIVELATGKVLARDVNLQDALDERIWTDEDLKLTGTKEERMRGRFNRLVLTKVV